jgi:pimeloyl-ACP methyl ester carboxylesterase
MPLYIASFADKSNHPFIHYLSIVQTASSMLVDVSVIADIETSDNQPKQMVVCLHGVLGSFWHWLYRGGMHQIICDEYRYLLSDYIFVFVSGMGSSVVPSYASLKDGDVYTHSWITNELRKSLHTFLGCPVAAPYHLFGISLGSYVSLRLMLTQPCYVRSAYLISPILAGADLASFLDESCCNESILSQPSFLSLYRNTLADGSWTCSISRICVDIGYDDPLYQSVRISKDLFSALSRHTSYSFCPGGHDWSYWQGACHRAVGWLGRR